ncbi:MAG: hypothetical protein J7M32_02565 [Deltaproteobacteria bacterium]|nr:hypothetical protein [Deltaproteobacteria bacterium]
MSDLDNDIAEVPQEAVENDAPEDFFIDILTGELTGELTPFESHFCPDWTETLYGDSGYDITAFDMAAGIEERSSMKFEKD